jgi:hypothetical protein
MERKEEFKNEIIEDAAYRKINLDENTITYYGEFCGKGIQKNVGISQIEKSIFLFATKISKIDDSEQGIYITPIISPFFCIKNVYNIKTFGTSEVSIDFNDARHDSDSLRFVVSEAERVENECPVAKGLGFPNTLGEGMVWSCFHNDEWIVFKVKGEKHQQKISRVKEKSAKQTIGEILAEQFCVMPRLDQVYTEVFDVLNGGKGDINRLGDFIKAVVKDVEKEEYLEIEKMGVTIKDVSKPISKIAKIYFLDRLKNEYFDRLKNE